jgi:surface antigen
VAIALGTSTISAAAACNGDTSTETILGAGSGAAVGGLASHSGVGAVVGGVAGGLIGNSIGRSNNREDCRREARAYDRDYRYRDYDYPDRSRYWVDRYGDRHYYDADDD